MCDKESGGVGWAYVPEKDEQEDKQGVVVSIAPVLIVFALVTWVVAIVLNYPLG